ncbi:Predicted arabinose efflux permease, MFS family [Marinactinospora thermotolerans DSM 45154]|uniref:Predicted arabinose efflux permease, MFS family n=2 Tax=Marinactinospora thermotolerans TaxID=531310 RepID=A0A1T4TD50_9ACTN|nr:Predicted arabinose efflux permease, MFS family [Marinactinospora thermotolerans DSM 45154]
MDLARLQRRTLVTLALAQTIGGVGVGSALSVGGLIAEELTGSSSWAGTATTTITLGAALFALPLAGLAARRGRRAGLGTGWFAAALGGAIAVAGASFASFPLFLAGMALFGSGSATGLQSRYAAADLAGERTRGRDLSIVVWATTVGSVAGPNLTGPGGVLAARVGLPELVGPLLFATAGFLAAGLLTLVLLRPDPLLTARRLAGAPARPPRRGSPRAAWRLVARTPRAALAMAGMALSHAVMVMVMTMTPVHMAHGGAELDVIGLTISLHIAGMYALSPVVGRLADRLGRVPVLVAGQAILLCSTVVSGLAGHSHAVTTVGLVLLGLGWSFALVSASTLLAESLEADRRADAQGLSDLVMNLCGAGGGALSGVLVGAYGFGTLNAVAATLTVVVVVLAARTWRLPRAEAGEPAGRG